jgi:hypothetical protein
MKLRPILLTAVVAMAAGALVAWNSSAPASGEKQDGAPASEPAPNAAAPVTDAFSFTAGNPRQVKLFSALKEPLRLRKQFLLFEAIQALQPGDFKAVVDHVEKLPMELSYDLLRLLLARWVEVDAPAAQAWILPRPTLHWGLSLWAKTNPEAALQAVMTLTDRSKADSLVPIAVQAMSGSPESKIAQVRQFPPSRARDLAIVRLLYEWAAKDPAAAFAALDQIPSGPDREETRSSILKSWARRDPAAALEKLAALLPTLKMGALGNELVTSLMDQIPDAQRQLALDWLKDLPIESRSTAGIAAARKWAGKDPAAALEWCLENGIEPARGHRHGFSGWGAGVLGEAIQNKPLETVAWLQQLPAGAERDRLSERALADSFWLLKKGEAFAKAEPALLRLFAQLPEDAQVRTAHEFGQRHAREGSLTDVRDWAQHFPTGPARANAIAGAMSGAYERDASRVDQVMENLATSADRDAALRGLATAMQENAPGDAATRAAAIIDASTRRETLETVILPWLKKDPTATREWLKNTARSIPPSWTEAWLQAK